MDKRMKHGRFAEVGYVYGIVADNQLKYVGRTSSIPQRYRNHRNTTCRDFTGPTEMVVFECCPLWMLKWAEAYWIRTALSWGCELCNQIANRHTGFPNKYTSQYWGRKTSTYKFWNDDSGLPSLVFTAK